jgi:hypothetical protein
LEGLSSSLKDKARNTTSQPSAPTQPASAAELSRLKQAQEAAGRVPSGSGSLPTPKEVPAVAGPTPLPEFDPSKALSDSTDASKALDKLKQLVGDRKK